MIDTERLDEEIRCAICRNQMKTDRGCDGNCRVDENLCKDIIRIFEKHLSPAQTEEAIPVSWIEARIERFKAEDNAFCGLTANIMHVMLNEWKREQEGETDGQN